jgi:hypothetical protein
MRHWRSLWIGHRRLPPVARRPAGTAPIGCRPRKAKRSIKTRSVETMQGFIGIGIGIETWVEIETVILPLKSSACKR